MMKNVGTIDRWVRGAAGVILLLAGYYWTTGGLSIASYIIGAIVLLTAITGFCPLYSFLGISTGKKM